MRGLKASLVNGCETSVCLLSVYLTAAFQRQRSVVVTVLEATKFNQI